jgi:hypothetical protein
MKSKHLAISLAVLAFALPIQGQKPPAPQSDQGRYQLLAVPLDDPYPASIGPSNSRRTTSSQLCSTLRRGACGTTGQRVTQVRCRTTPKTVPARPSRPKHLFQFKFGVRGQRTK